LGGGVADIIRAHHPQFPSGKARALVERGLKVGSVGTRKTFYLVITHKSPFARSCTAGAGGSPTAA
jgi:hypothetical protein